MMSTRSMGGIKANAELDFGPAFLPEKDNFGCYTSGAGLGFLANAAEEKRQAAEWGSNHR